MHLCTVHDPDAIRSLPPPREGADLLQQRAEWVCAFTPALALVCGIALDSGQRFVELAALNAVPAPARIDAPYALLYPVLTLQPGARFHVYDLDGQLGIADGVRLWVIADAPRVLPIEDAEPLLKGEADACRV